MTTPTTFRKNDEHFKLNLARALHNNKEAQAYLLSGITGFGDEIDQDHFHLIESTFGIDSIVDELTPNEYDHLRQWQDDNLLCHDWNITYEGIQKQLEKDSDYTLTQILSLAVEYRLITPDTWIDSRNQLELEVNNAIKEEQRGLI